MSIQIYINVHIYICVHVYVNKCIRENLCVIKGLESFWFQRNIFLLCFVCQRNYMLISEITKKQILRKLKAIQLQLHYRINQWMHIDITNGHHWEINNTSFKDIHYHIISHGIYFNSLEIMISKPSYWFPVIVSPVHIYLTADLMFTAKTLRSFYSEIKFSMKWVLRLFIYSKPHVHCLKYGILSLLWIYMIFSLMWY